jgi:hypothetical protein
MILTKTILADGLNTTGFRLTYHINETEKIDPYGNKVADAEQRYVAGPAW